MIILQSDESANSHSISFAHLVVSKVVWISKFKKPHSDHFLSLSLSLSVILLQSSGCGRLRTAARTVHEHNEAQLHRLRRSALEDIRIQAKHFGSAFSIGFSIISEYHLVNIIRWTFTLSSAAIVHRNEAIESSAIERLAKQEVRNLQKRDEFGNATKSSKCHKRNRAHERPVQHQLSSRTFFFLNWERDQLFRIWNYLVF